MPERALPGADVSVPMTADVGVARRACFSAMSAGLDRPEGVALAPIEVTAAEPELGLVLNERLAAPMREWVAERV